MDNIDVIDLIDIAKINLIKKINLKMEKYNNNPTTELKKEIIELVKDRNQLFSYNIDIIKKYI